MELQLNWGGHYFAVVLVVVTVVFVTIVRVRALVTDRFGHQRLGRLDDVDRADNHAVKIRLLLREHLLDIFQ